MHRLCLALLILASTACAYHSPTGPTPPAADVTSPATLTLDVTPGTQAAGRTAAITATVRNRAGAPLAAVAIAFSTDVGTVPAVAVTDTAGAAHVTLIGPVGPARLTASAGSLTTTALVALQPGSGLPNATQDPTPTPTPTPLPTPPDTPTPLPLTAQIVSTTGVAGTSTFFGLSVSAPVASSVWTFGDASAPVTIAGPSTSHVYAAGSYTASVVVTDTANRTASAQASLNIAPASSAPPAPAPTLAAVITCAPPATHNPATATPCNVSATYGGTPVASGVLTRVDWDWGDGATTPSGGVVNTHTYVNAGTYTVLAAVTATTIDGPKTTTASKAVIIP